MYKEKTFLAVIPARGGSKRLPNKNILLLGGKPLIAWTIEAARKSKYIDEVFVSTDSSEIKSTAEQYGVKVPFLRPEELAQDDTPTIDVIKHIIDYYKKNQRKFDYIVLLQPTSPLRTFLDIDNAIELLEKKKADGIISVTEAPHSPLWMNTLPDDLSMVKFLNPALINKRSQDLPKYYMLNGAIYIGKVQKVLKENTFFLSRNIYAYLMPRERSVDIDNKIDFKLAEILIKERD